MAFTLTIFQHVIEMVLASSIGAVVDVLDHVVFLDTPHMTFLDMLVTMAVISEVYDFFDEIRSS